MLLAAADTDLVTIPCSQERHDKSDKTLTMQLYTWIALKFHTYTQTHNQVRRTLDMSDMGDIETKLTSLCQKPSLEVDQTWSSND